MNNKYLEKIAGKYSNVVKDFLKRAPTKPLPEHNWDFGRTQKTLQHRILLLNHGQKKELLREVKQGNTPGKLRLSTSGAYGSMPQEFKDTALATKIRDLAFGEPD